MKGCWLKFYIVMDERVLGLYSILHIYVRYGEYVIIHLIHVQIFNGEIEQ